MINQKEKGQGNMATGIIKKWIDDKGFGFVKPDGGQPDIFCHAKAWPIGVSPTEGMRITFEIANDSRSGKTQAVNVQMI